MADEKDDGKGAPKLDASKDLKQSHTTYEQAQKLRATLHDGLIAADYRRGYVSTDESPGEDNAPLTTTRVSYSHLSDKGKRCELVQTFKNFKGAGETMLTHEKRDKDNKLTGASPSAY